jgi:hypothetical protein
MRLLYEQSIRCDLYPVSSPGFASTRSACRAPALVLIGNQLAAPLAQDIDGAAYSELRALKLQTLDGVAFALGDLDVEASARVHGGVRDADPLDLFEVEQPLAVDQRVKRSDAKQWVFHHQPIVGN